MPRRGTTSTAVQATRRSAAGALDFFPTPPWATRALVETILLPELGVADFTPLLVWEPCCGAGHMAIPLAEYFGRVRASDVHDWGFGERRDFDFTLAGADAVLPRPDWIIANPPFVLAERFVDRALTISIQGVAMLLRLQWLEGGDRYQLIFAGDRKPALLCPFAERVPMIQGCYDPEATTATAYAWFVWRLDRPAPLRTSLVHIPPGMAQLHFKPTDEALTNRGEAARRRSAKAAAPEA